MNKKVLIQFSLLLTICISCLIFYKLFFFSPDLELKDIKKSQQDQNGFLGNGTNQMNDITYNSKYLDDNKYIIKAKFAEFNEDYPDIMLLTNVKGKIFFESSGTVEIFSNKALYNSVNYNTNFYNKVLVVYENNQINSNNFDLFFDKKIGTIYGDVIYKNLNTTLEADKIDIDLITKDSKIYMLDKSKKINIKNLN